MTGFHKGPMGFQIDMENGWTVSVQFGIGNYCNNRSGRGNPFTDIAEFIDCSDAEIAAWRTDSRGEGKGASTQEWYLFEDGEQVKGWQTPAKVLRFMNLIALKPNPVESKEGGEYLSECCDSTPIGELDFGTSFADTKYYTLGFCSRCRDNAVFTNEVR